MKIKKEYFNSLSLAEKGRLLTYQMILIESGTPLSDDEWCKLLNGRRNFYLTLDLFNKYGIDRIAFENEILDDLLCKEIKRKQCSDRKKRQRSFNNKNLQVCSNFAATFQDDSCVNDPNVTRDVTENVNHNKNINKSCKFAASLQRHSRLNTSNVTRDVTSGNYLTKENKQKEKKRTKRKEKQTKENKGRELIRTYTREDSHSHSKNLAKNIFNSIRSSWKDERIGDYESEYKKFLKSVNFKDERELQKFRLATQKYQRSKDWRDGVVRYFENFIPLWRNFIPKETHFQTTLSPRNELDELGANRMSVEMFRSIKAPPGKKFCMEKRGMDAPVILGSVHSF